MIAKIDIENFGIFKDFKWDDNVVDNNGNILKLKDINIIYGRNYSGKTTLSRIIRILEIKSIPDKYENPKFRISLQNEDIIDETNYQSYENIVRVFNEDFIRDNLSFILNQDEKINAFAILGDNSKIKKEIEKLEDKLGNEEENTGLYEELKKLKNLKNDKFKEYDELKEDINSKKRIKAIDRKQGIKYQSDRFGDQNYNISKLDNEIKEVIKDNYKPLIDEEKKELEKLIKETKLDIIPELQDIELNFEKLSQQTKLLLEKKIIGNEKIEELVDDYVLNKWADNGYKIHKEKNLKTCAFCGNTIQDDRWKMLEKHFDKETEQLKEDIENLLKSIENEKVKNNFKVDKKLFYSKFHSELEEVEKEYKIVLDSYLKVLDNLKLQLEKRKKDIIHIQIYNEVNFDKSQFNTIFEKYDEIRKQSNSFSEALEKEQKKAFKKLRLLEVYNFIKIIDYENKTKNITEKKQQYEKAKKDFEDKEEEIENIKQQIEEQKKLLKNEGEGAKKVNYYLNDFLGHQKLHLEPVDEKDEITKDKQIKFEVYRDAKKAYNLSEGEKSLISFCYFLAKLEDAETKGTKPIIWIDDPISSLDGNHIFFIYSLINGEIVQKNNFTQLFISTHNLNFLKYLKRLPGALKIKETTTRYRYLIISKNFLSSVITIMPKYLKEHVTEFNYLFKQLYECSNLESVDDNNYVVYYNFGNNARKFLEIFLFYKYPDFSSDAEKYEKFFNDKVPALFSTRINNKYSHLAGGLERGETPIEVPEMNKVAKLILKRLEELDIEQYKSLLKSIGVDYE